MVCALPCERVLPRLLQLLRQLLRQLGEVVSLVTPIHFHGDDVLIDSECHIRGSLNETSCDILLDSDQVFDFCSPATHSTSHQPARLLQRSLRRADNGQVLTISIGQGALVGTAIGIGLGAALGLALMTRARHA